MQSDIRHPTAADNSSAWRVSCNEKNATCLSRRPVFRSGRVSGVADRDSRRVCRVAVCGGGAVSFNRQVGGSTAETRVIVEFDDGAPKYLGSNLVLKQTAESACGEEFEGEEQGNGTVLGVAERAQDSELRIGEWGEAENLSQFLASEQRSHAEVNF